MFGLFIRRPSPAATARKGAFTLLSLGLVSGACTSLLGIDGEYVSAVNGSPDAGAAPAETGGEGGAASESGGTSDIGGTGAGGAATCNPACTGTKKCCPGAPGTGLLCIERQPAVGCSRDACDPCPDPPPHGSALCTVGLCDFKCDDKFERVGALCEPIASGSGGAGGAGGAGGTPSTGGTAGAGTGGAPACDPKKCPSVGGTVPGCSIVSPFGCCTKDGKCGCSYVAMAYCL